MDISKFEVDVWTDMYVAGFDDDGSDYIAEAYSVVIETPQGRRFQHGASFKSAKRVSTEDGYDWEDIRPEAMAKAEKLVAKIKAAGNIDPSYWTEIFPVYGSAAYEFQHQKAADNGHDMVDWSY